MKINNYFLNKTIYVVLLSLISTLTLGQGYNFSLEGGTWNGHGNVTTQQVTMLVGGAEVGGDGEVNATQWFVNQSGGGDYLVLRTDAVGGQASWVWSNFSSSISSAAELSITTANGANNATVAQYIRDAEALFIAGGDQREYMDLWKGTAVADAINYLINDKKVPVGGTSAGMAIMGGAYYAPATSGVLSSEILNDPFHQYTNNSFFYNDFLQNPYLTNVITDTHLDRTHGTGNENRYGRAFGILARTISDQNDQQRYAIACDEAAFVCIDASGNAKVFGDGGQTQYPTKAYFMVGNCSTPETISAGQPLVWNKNGEAVKAYVIQGSVNGNGNSFSLNDWETASGGGWMNLYTTNGYSGFNYVNGSGASTGASAPSCDGGTTPPTVEQYCDSYGNSTSYEFIDEVGIDGNYHFSGNDNGYGDYTSVSFNLTKGGSHTFFLDPNTSSRERVVVWIDYNQDGVFDANTEEVLYKQTRRSFSSSFTVPSTALSGATRMRVSMQYASDGYPYPCDVLDYGEVEDYTVVISNSSSQRLAGVTVEAEGSRAYPNPTNGRLTYPSTTSNITLVVVDALGRELRKVASNTIDISDLNNGLYYLRIIEDGEESVQKIIKN
ncbi:T9SS type A sorting domain-containing protein [Flammeovirga sp. MY04]|uniref:GEVED domain-containing protein n=1 Tax=Flammeovirga sp. MY04 TaxID=1191459 RepID=UPI0008061FC8|nr:GEVED domain-containing protein [Flammeovirga sp. MY04]ANQ51875.1 T9SS type A sorting domain-containing protein [Flammeovirga sp. MY04]